MGSLRCQSARAYTTSGTVTTSLSGGTWNATTAFNSGTTTLTCTGYDNFDQAGAQTHIDVNINLPKPTISAYSVAPGMVTSISDFTLSYKVTVSGVVTTEFRTIHLSEGSNSVLITTDASNEVGAHGSATISYWLRGAVIFVDGTANGNNDGTSWADAYSRFESALQDPRSTSASTQIWVSKATYQGVSAVTVIPLPENALIYGGFDATEFPSDISKRNLVTNVALLENYDFGPKKLGNRIEFNGFQFLDTRIEGTVGVAKIGGTISVTNCKILGISSYYNNWNIDGGTTAINFEMVNDTVLYTSGHASWGMDFKSVGGKFSAKYSKFVGGGEFFQPAIFRTGLIDNVGDFLFTADFDHCELNYPEKPDSYQIVIENPNASAYFNYCAVKGGVGSITIPNQTNLHYDDIDRHNTTIP